MPPPLVASELDAFRYAFGGWRRRPPGDGFSMHRERSYLVVVGVLVFLVAVETAGLHLVLARFAPALAWASTALSVYAIVWFVGDAQAVRLHPVRLLPEGLDIQQGLRWRVRVPWGELAAAEPIDSAPKDALRIGILGANVLLRLHAPVLVRGPFGLQRRAGRLALTVDRRDAFLAALAARR